MNQLAFEASAHTGSWNGYPQPHASGNAQGYYSPAPPSTNQYTSAPSAHPVPAQAPYVAPPRQTAPQPPPNAASQLDPSNSPTKYPMAAPPLPHSPANLQQQTSDNTASTPKSPQSPGAQSLEQQRIALLLSINLDLLEEVNRLQQAGHGGMISTLQQQKALEAGQNVNMASEDFIHCMRRVQANLTYMMPKAQPHQPGAKVQAGPAHMSPPPHMSGLREKYEQLQELFPGWAGLEQRGMGGGNLASPGANGVNNAGA